MAAAASALAPTASLCLKPYSTFRFLSTFSIRTLRIASAAAPITSASNPLSFPLLRRRHSPPPPFSGTNHHRCFSAMAGAVVPGEAAKPDSVPPAGGERVGEFRRRQRVVDIKGGPNEGLELLGQTLVVRGWVRTLRVQSSVTFIEVNDGSCLSNMQCVMDSEAEGYDQVESGLITTGASLWLQGTLVRSQGSKQKVELKVEKILLIGKSDPSFPIQKKRVSKEYLRTKAHLRPRTNTFGAVARVRNALAYATHTFFQENGFVWVSSPIITASDCEGAGEQFCVTTLIPSSQEATSTLVEGIPKTGNGLIDWSQEGEKEGWTGQFSLLADGFRDIENHLLFQINLLYFKTTNP